MGRHGMRRSPRGKHRGQDPRARILERRAVLSASARRHRRVYTPKRSPVRNCLRVVLAVIFIPLTATLALAQTVSGRVIDSSGRMLPRAYVRAIAPGSTSAPAVFTDTEGRFRIETASTSCTIEVSLTGFTTTTVPCANHLDVKLDVAPVSEHVIVAATRSAMPAGELGNSVTAF